MSRDEGTGPFHDRVRSDTSSGAKARPVLVLVHGANHQRTCWDPTVDALRRIVPDGSILAVDLPGRGSNHIEPEHISIGACVDSLVRDIEDRAIDRVVLVGHSLGGVTIAGAAARLGPARVNHLVFIAATIPPDGHTVLDTFGLPLRLTVPFVARRRRLANNPRWTARRSFCNGMTPDQRAFVLDNLCPDAPWLLTEPVATKSLPPGIERTWVLTTRDRAVSPARQKRNMANLGAVGRVIDIDSCHDVMVSHPDQLARAIARCWHPPVATAPSDTGPPSETART